MVVGGFRWFHVLVTTYIRTCFVYQAELVLIYIWCFMDQFSA